VIVAVCAFVVVGNDLLEPTLKLIQADDFALHNLRVCDERRE
jgi:hypothetical protein